VFQILVGARHAHAAYVDDRATWLDNEPASLLCRQSGREHHPACAHCDISIPPDHVNGAVVVLIAFHPVRNIDGRGPSAVEHGITAQPVRGLAFGVVDGHPVVEARPRQHPGDESVKRRTIHATTLPGAQADVNWSCGPVSGCDVRNGSAQAPWRFQPAGGSSFSGG
jgi:hypothetical protein